MKEILQIVKDAAKDLIECYDGYLEYLGKYKGNDAYACVLPDDVTIGFPSVYLLNNGKVDIVTDAESLHTCNISMIFFAENIKSDTLQTEDSALPVNQNGGVAFLR